MRQWMFEAAGTKARKLDEDQLDLIKDDFMPGEVSKIKAMVDGDTIQLDGQRGMPLLVVSRLK